MESVLWEEYAAQLSGQLVAGMGRWEVYPAVPEQTVCVRHKYSYRPPSV
eukprot:CAMPEP_0174311004 /NCGR_PEP_ID=MMETSP0810-20121108/3428_1 /TAXON_ID=73025 ORGANISM="Eutreptiella gymnastica-like, Strain CCMP1594" /NCGR_SAMPLE_ID=MMETSP0810 /ASSEMBLY_ACC=CAM_ASM_000659 /LENGTH=48 /DNA_ID= /DNA_START= /DNA_END= /DNA_ORIENTATION=